MKQQLLLLLLAPALLALTARAGEPSTDELTIDQLIERLGADDYAVREAATKALIARGPAAIPALEKAVQAEDVEVRMRAGRALRSLREEQGPDTGKQREDAEPAPKDSPVDPAGKNIIEQRSVSMSHVNGEWVVTITRGAGADRTTQTFKGASLEELKQQHPEVRDALGGTTFELGRPRGFADPFKDFDKWFEESGFGNRRGRDPFGGIDDLEAEIARLRQWARWMAAQRSQRGGIDPRQRAQRDAEALLLGVQVRSPEPVLDAQLQLRGRGLVVESVVPNTIAARLGLQRFDIVLELNDVTVRSAADVRPALLSRNPKEPITAKVMRLAKELSLKESAAPPTSEAK